MRVSIESLPKFVNWCLIVLSLLVGFGGGVLGFLLLRPHLGSFLSGAIAVLLALVVLATRYFYALVAHPVTLLLATICRLEVRQYESCPRYVRYFVLGKEDGLRYFKGVGLLGQMESFDWLNEHEFQTLKGGGTLPR